MRGHRECEEGRDLQLTVSPHVSWAQVPYSFAFNNREGSNVLTMNLFCDIIFMLDVLLQFCFSFRDENDRCVAVQTGGHVVAVVSVLVCGNSTRAHCPADPLPGSFGSRCPSPSGTSSHGLLSTLSQVSLSRVNRHVATRSGGGAGFPVRLLF